MVERSLKFPLVFANDCEQVGYLCNPRTKVNGNSRHKNSVVLCLAIITKQLL